MITLTNVAFKCTNLIQEEKRAQLSAKWHSSPVTVSHFEFRASDAFCCVRGLYVGALA